MDSDVSGSRFSENIIKASFVLSIPQLYFLPHWLLFQAGNSSCGRLALSAANLIEMSTSFLMLWSNS